jgi:LmbE family N-acetylglucosaminyl deacetylase
MPSRRFTVLGLFAHPDDETFGPGATLARLSSEGHEVHLVTATRGEAGSIGASATLGRRALGELREREMAAAARVLGARSLEQLVLPDGGLARLAEETLLRPFVSALRRVRPDIVMTFHANGISGHPDHRTVTARSLAAFALAADPAFAPDLGAPHAASRLWTYCVAESKAERITWRRIHSVPDRELDAVIDVAAFVPAKRAAAEAHASQAPFIHDMERRLGDLTEQWSTEAFVLSAARLPLPEGSERPVDDLFAGMR